MLSIVIVPPVKVCIPMLNMMAEFTYPKGHQVAMNP